MTQGRIVIDENVTVEVNNANEISRVLVQNQALDELLSPLLLTVLPRAGTTFVGRAEIYLPSRVDEIADKVFGAIEKLQTVDQNMRLAAFLASHFYSLFTGPSRKMQDGWQHTLVASLWLRLLKQAWDWESKHPKSKIPKGEIYHWTASTFLRLGDIDAGFTYLYNAMEEAKNLAGSCPDLHYPEQAPSYLTSSLIDDPRNSMIDFVQEIREKFLHKYIESYNARFGRSLTPELFDAQFLQNRLLDDEKFFFVFNIWALYGLQRNAEAFLRENAFSRLRNLDVIFNLCLIIDKVLEKKYGGRRISDNAIAICRDEKWMSKSELNDFEAKKLEGIEREDLDGAIRALLKEESNYGRKPDLRRVQHFLIAWRLRNYGGHNIQQQKVLVEKFEDIISVLMNCIFITIEAQRSWRNDGRAKSTHVQ